MDTKTLVFYVDIDDTIVDTALQVIEAVLNKFPMASQTSALELTQKYWQPAHVPEFQQPEIIDYINSCLTSADFIRQLKPRTGAVEEIKQLAEIGNIAAYISSRSHKLQAVSEDWLSKHNFPDARVVLREDSDTNPAWKLEYIIAKAKTAAAAQPTNSVLIEDNHELVPLFTELVNRQGESKIELWLIGNSGVCKDVHKSTPNLRYFSSLSDVYAKIFTGGPHAQA